MKKIPLTQGKYALVDDEDYDWLNQWKWNLSSHGYPKRTAYKNRKYETIFMHKLIMQTPKGMHTDHINHNILDNRRKNLRIVTPHQNFMNRVIPKNNTSGFKGVTWQKANKKWTAHIGYNFKKLYLGIFENKEDAIRTYNLKAKELYGEYVLKN